MPFNTHVAKLGWSVSVAGRIYGFWCIVACTGSTEPELLRIVPASVSSGQATAGEIRGSNLYNGLPVALDNESPIERSGPWGVQIDSSSIDGVNWVSTSTLQFTIPSGLAAGSHPVTVVSPRGRVFLLAEALIVNVGISKPESSDAGTVRDLLVRTTNGETGESSDASIANAGADGGVEPSRPRDAGFADAIAVPDAQPDPVVCGPFGNPEKLTGFGVTGRLFAPTLGPNSQELLFARLGTVEAIVVATRSDLGSGFSAAIEAPGINGTNGDGTPFLSVDGLSLFFHSSRPGGPGGRDIWQADRGVLGGVWNNVRLVPNINSTSTDHLPFVSDNGLEMIFSSDRAGGSGETDLWVSRRNSPLNDFPAAVPLGGINTSNRESSPHLSADGFTLYFSSDRTGGAGNDDIWVSSRSDLNSEFGSPISLSNVNSGLDELDPSLSPDEQELFFSSDRDGLSQLWRVVRTCL